MLILIFDDELDVRFRFSVFWYDYKMGSKVSVFIEGGESGVIEWF